MPKDLTCDECGATFERPQALGAHRRYTHGGGKKAKPDKPEASAPAVTEPKKEKREKAAVSTNGTDLVDRIRAEISEQRTIAGRACRRADVLEKALKELEE